MSSEVNPLLEDEVIVESTESDARVEASLYRPIPASQFNHLALLFIVIFANVGTLLFGYEAGSCTWIIYIIYYRSLETDDVYSWDNTVYNNSNLLGLVGASASLGAIIIFPLLIQIGDRVSKKFEMLLAAGLYFVGGLLVSISSSLNWHYSTGYTLLILGRVLYGCGVGATLHSVPQYISEIAPAQIRGQFGSSIEVMIAIGVTIGFLVGYVYDSAYSWTQTFVVAYCLALGMGLLAAILPHPPAWLLHKHRSEEEVLDAVRFVCPDATMEHVTIFKENIAEEQNYKRKVEHKLMLYQERHSNSWFRHFGFYDLLVPQLQMCLHDRGYRRSLLLMIGIAVAKVFSGQTVIMCYASTFFSSMSSRDVDSLVFGFILLRATVSFLMLIFAEFAGRRKFLLVSCSLMSASLFIGGVCKTYDLNTVALVMLFVSGAAFQFGFASLSYFLVNEVSPYYLRSTAVAVSNSAYFFLNFILTFLFPHMHTGFGISGMLMLFGVTNAFCFLFVYYFIPETRGLDLAVSYHEVNKRFDRLTDEWSQVSFLRWLCCLRKQHVERSVVVQVEVDNTPSEENSWTATTFDI
jgi:MFS family permease